jgi:hypothetical protein
MGHGIEATGSLEAFLNLPPTERALTAGMVRKARAWEIEQLAEALGGKNKGSPK